MELQENTGLTQEITQLNENNTGQAQEITQVKGTQLFPLRNKFFFFLNSLKADAPFTNILSDISVLQHQLKHSMLSLGMEITMKQFLWMRSSNSQIRLLIGWTVRTLQQVSVDWLDSYDVTSGI